MKKGKYFKQREDISEQLDQALSKYIEQYGFTFQDMRILLSLLRETLMEADFSFAMTDDKETQQAIYEATEAVEQALKALKRMK